jgi:hypothetical protein
LGAKLDQVFDGRHLLPYRVIQYVTFERWALHQLRGLIDRPVRGPIPWGALL